MPAICLFPTDLPMHIVIITVRLLLHEAYIKQLRVGPSRHFFQLVCPLARCGKDNVASSDFRVFLGQALTPLESMC